MKLLVDEMKNKLFDISMKPLIFRCEEDKLFFENQQGSREFTIGLIYKDDNRKIRECKKRKERDMKKDVRQALKVTQIDELDSDSEEQPSNDAEYIPPEVSLSQRRRLRPRKT